MKIISSSAKYMEVTNLPITISALGFASFRFAPLFTSTFLVSKYTIPDLAEINWEYFRRNYKTDWGLRGVVLKCSTF